MGEPRASRSLHVEKVVEQQNDMVGQHNNDPNASVASTTSASHPRRYSQSGNGLKRYECNFCDYANGNKGILNDHIRTHDQLQHQCDNCLKRFTTSGGMKRHKKVHSRRQTLK